MSQNSQFTQHMQAMLPQWMKMAKDPNSVGARFLNVFGLEFEEVKSYLDQATNNQYIDEADIGQIDVAYKVPLALPVVLDLVELDEVSVVLQNGEPENFRMSYTLRDFYKDDGENKVVLDRDGGVVFLRPTNDLIEENLLAPFQSVTVNGTMHYEYSLHHIWNAFDEFGLLLGIERLFGERNAAFKERILDIFRKPGNATQGGIVNGLSRELGLPVEAIRVNEFADKAFRGTLLNEDGSPGKKLLGYVERVNKIFGFSWDNMAWGEAYWRSVEESQTGLEYLPHVWDASSEGWLDRDFQSGIGDGDELKVAAPKDEENIRKFDYKVGLRGRNSGLERIDPELGFKYKITAKGMILDEEYRPEVYKYTVHASEIMKLRYIIRATRDYEYQTVIDFDPEKAGYQFDDTANPSIEIIKGTTNLSKTDMTYPYYKVIAEMSTRSISETPQLQDLTIKWLDTGGAVNSYTLTTQDDFTNNTDNVLDTETTDVFVTPEGIVELGFGDFYNMIDTEGSFMEGEHSGIVEITQNGTLRLNLPNT